jgi:hypothetical protein
MCGEKQHGAGHLDKRARASSSRCLALNKILLERKNILLIRTDSLADEIGGTQGMSFAQVQALVDRIQDFACVQLQSKGRL